MRGVYIALGLMLAFIFILLIISRILDCFIKNRYYPHEKLSKSSLKFCTVLGYSLVYNLPLISLFSYQDKVIPNFAKALWLSMIYSMIIVLSFVSFMIGLINGSIIYTSITLSLILAIMLIPNSIFIKMIRVQANEI